MVIYEYILQKNYYYTIGGNKMKKLKLKKIILGSLVVTSMLALNSVGASAEWKKDNTGWWYTEGNSWAKGWRLIDNKWYYFNTNGYMAHDTTIEGNTVNSNGEFVLPQLEKKEIDMDVVNKFKGEWFSSYKEDTKGEIVPLKTMAITDKMYGDFPYTIIEAKQVKRHLDKTFRSPEDDSNITNDTSDTIDTYYMMADVNFNGYIERSKFYILKESDISKKVSNVETLETYGYKPFGYVGGEGPCRIVN